MKIKSRLLSRVKKTVAILLLLLCPVSLHAAQLILAWDPVTPAPDGYTLYHRIKTQGYDYSQPIWTGSQTTATLNNLDEDAAYCFVVRAFVGEQDSANSNEVCADLTGRADSDNDGISDQDEIDIYQTDPYDPDSDDDGLQDGTEIGLTLEDIGESTDVSVFVPDMDPSTTTDPLDDDCDNDGFTDGDEDENHNGAIDGNETNPNMPVIPWLMLLLSDDE